jgi:hypothetical protein
MIDFEKLDKRKTYLGLQYGTSLIAKQIKRFSKCYAPDSKEIPSHVLAFVYRLGEWWIYESHADGNKDLGVPSGVRRYKLSVWLQIEKNTQNQFKAVPFKINFKSLEHYIGLPYGTGDIKELLKAALFHSNGKQKDRKGLICSEYIALCAPYVSEFYNLPAYCITPAHFEDYLLKNPAEPDIEYKPDKTSKCKHDKKGGEK